MRAASPVVGGLAAQLLRLLLLLHIFWIGLRATRRPTAALRALRMMRREKRHVSGGANLGRIVRTGSRYLLGLNSPAWPSLSFRLFIEGELWRSSLPGGGRRRLQSLIFGITSRCPLRCRHCFAGDVLDDAEPLSLDQLRRVLQRFQSRGVAQVQWSGGEPFERFDDMMALTEAAQPGTEFWVLTSGFGMDAGRARRMRRAGIRGVNVSLDHWDPMRHNAFRGSSEAFSLAIRAAGLARKQDLAVCLSLCATRDFVTAENLGRYMDLARDLGVGFVQILEARPIGRFAGQDVSLAGDQIRLLDDFYRLTSRDRSCRSMPVVAYHGYHQRRYGCYGGGDRFLYVDPRGDIYPCPFSSTRLGNALTDALDAGRVRCEEQCDRFGQANPTGRNGSHRVTR